MKISATVFLFALLTVSYAYACDTSGKQQDTLNYTHETIKQRANDCGNKPDNGCTVVTIS